MDLATSAGQRLGEHGADGAVVIGDQDRMFVVWKALFDAGLFTNPVTSPAVPPQMDLIRTSYMATHTPQQIDRVLEIFEAVGKRTGIVAGLETATPPRYGKATG